MVIKTQYEPQKCFYSVQAFIEPNEDWMYSSIFGFY